MDNPEEINDFIIKSFKEGNEIKLKDIHDKPISNKRMLEASDVQKPCKKKYVHQKYLEKEIEEVVPATKIIPSKTRSGRPPHKVTFVYVVSRAPKRKKILRKLAELEEEEEEEDVSVSFTKKRLLMGWNLSKFKLQRLWPILSLLCMKILVLLKQLSQKLWILQKL